MINVPMTYPLKPIDGYLISGFDTPMSVERYTTPPDLLQRMAQDGLTYDLIQAQHALSSTQRDVIPLERYVTKAQQVIDQQAEIIEYAIQRWNMDFLMTVCQMTDFINHRTTDEEAICAVYRRADAFVGRVLEHLPDDATVFIVSDHGSQPARRRVSLLRALADAGLIAFKPEVPANTIRRKVQRVLASRLPLHLSESLSRFVSQVWDRLPGWIRRVISAPVLKANPGAHMHSSTVDWARTKAYTLSHLGPIYVNLRGREPQGIVEREEYETVCRQVTEALTAIVDPGTGEHPFSGVTRAAAVWHGPYMDIAPDLIYDWNDEGYAVVSTLPDGSLFAAGLDNGVHANYGVLILSGPGIQPGCEIEGATLMDVAPTALALMGIPLPEGMDGRVVMEALTPTFSQDNPIMYQEAETDYAPSGEQVYTDEQVAEVEERLRGLGYLE